MQSYTFNLWYSQAMRCVEFLEGCMRFLFRFLQLDYKENVNVLWYQCHYAIILKRLPNELILLFYLGSALNRFFMLLYFLHLQRFECTYFLIYLHLFAYLFFMNFYTFGVLKRFRMYATTVQSTDYVLEYKSHFLIPWADKKNSMEI